MVYLSIYFQDCNPFKIKQLELLHALGCWSYDPNPKKKKLHWLPVRHCIVLFIDPESETRRILKRIFLKKLITPFLVLLDDK